MITPASAIGPLAESYHERGNVLLRDCLPLADITRACTRLESMVDALARDMVAAGEISDLHADLPIDRRLPALAPRCLPRVWPLTERFHDHPEPFAIAHHPTLLDAVEQIIGSEITFHGHYHLRASLPDVPTGAFPWHQDSQYYGAPTRAMSVVTAWIPFVDTDAQSGCLWLIPGSQRWGLFASTRNSNSQEVTDEDVERIGEPMPMPMRPGDVLLFSNLTFHTSRLNRSGRVRWSIDCRFHPTRGSAPMGQEERVGYETLYQAWRAAGVVPVAVRSRRGGELPEFAQWQAWRREAAAAIAR